MKKKRRSKKRFTFNCEPGHRCEYHWNTEWNHVWKYIGSVTLAFCQITTHWCRKCGTLRDTTEGKHTYTYRSENAEA